MAKPTFSQIAQRAGVGTATVERVLNGRGGVTPATAQKVVVAAKALDWPGRLPDRHRGLIRIEVLLVRADTTFFQRLSRTFRRISSTTDALVQIQVTFVDEGDPAEISARISDTKTHRSALIVAIPDEPSVTAALQMAAQQVPTVQIVNSVSDELDFVGIDNYAAGRMAGLLLSRMTPHPGTVVAMCHGPGYKVHRDRILGFSDYIAEHPSGELAFEYVSFSGDDRGTAYSNLVEMLSVQPDIAALYNAGGGNVGVIGALSQADRELFVVAHELAEDTTTALRAKQIDIVMDQQPEVQARRAVDMVMCKLGLLPGPIANPPIRFSTITAENL